MENSNIDETRPTPLFPGDEPVLHLDETTSVPLNPQEANSPAIDNTQPTPVDGDKSTLGETLPTLRPSDSKTDRPVDAEGSLNTSDTDDLDATLAVPVAIPTEEVTGYADTTGIPVIPPIIPAGPTPPNRERRGSRLLITLGGVLVLLIIAALSGLGGYSTGIAERKAAEFVLRADRAKQQFELAQQDIDNNLYDRARQRLEYVAQLDPAYPGVTDKLSEVLAQLNSTATPTPAPTGTPVPIVTVVSGQGSEVTFNQAQQSLANKQWSNAIDTALKLRKDDPSYQTVALDGMLFWALRNRGMDKIGKLKDLEGGIYDLTLAQKFGPLDTEAQGYLNWASLYITGASFWDLDWEKAVYYFSQVAPALPGLTDGSGMTSTERYRQALIGYGDTLLKNGDACKAQDQYQQALAMGNDDQAQQSLNEASAQCDGGNTDNTQDTSGSGGKKNKNPKNATPKP